MHALTFTLASKFWYLSPSSNKHTHARFLECICACAHMHSTITNALVIVLQDKYHARGMRIDYCLVSESLRRHVLSSTIIGKGIERREGFFGASF